MALSIMTQFLGGTGNDIIDGGRGADIIDGGDDNDTLTYINSGSGVTIDIQAGTGSGGDAEGDQISNIETVYGSDIEDIISTANLGSTVLAQQEMTGLPVVVAMMNFMVVMMRLLIGGEGDDDELYGDGRVDTLIGGAGADLLHGGTGNDTADYSAASSGIHVDLLAGARLPW